MFLLDNTLYTAASGITFFIMILFCARTKQKQDPVEKMAGRFGLSSSGSTSMIVTNTPSQDLALTNLAFCSPSDLPKFAVPGHNNLYLASIADSFWKLIIRSGHIALNSIQRRCAKVSAAESIALSRFVPPDNFNLAVLTLELDFIKKGNKSEHIDAVVLAKQLRKRFINQVMTAGQKVLFEYHGNNYSFTVTQATVEDQDKSDSLERGMISDDTYIVFETSRDSGIKNWHCTGAIPRHYLWSLLRIHLLSQYTISYQFEPIDAYGNGSTQVCVCDLGGGKGDIELFRLGSLCVPPPLFCILENPKKAGLTPSSIPIL
ncbi:hypothetical protein VNO77_04974 [Canavalia gladiata]|uniref:Vesicle-fusing ATPase n=1 Tax=Canavalia gladiata TaxID=3824 RepID=A0AAN9MXJ2_CANGL